MWDHKRTSSKVVIVASNTMVREPEGGHFQWNTVREESCGTVLAPRGSRPALELVLSLEESDRVETFERRLCRDA
jgi:hypothetical protein